MEYLPKQWSRTDTTDGDITSYVLSTSTDGVTFTERTTGSWLANGDLKVAEWPATNAAYVRLQVNAASGDYVNICEMRIGGRTATPVLVSETPTFRSSDYYKLVSYSNRMVLDGRGSGGDTRAGRALRRGWS